MLILLAGADKCTQHGNLATARQGDERGALKNLKFQFGTSKWGGTRRNTAATLVGFDPPTED